MPNESTPGLALPTGRFAGRGAFEVLVRAALTEAARAGWPELILCDASFEDWPLGESAVVQSLNDWAYAGHRCTLLAAQFAALQRSKPRFVSWRKTWSHRIDCRVWHTSTPADFPSVLWSRVWCLHRIDPVHSAGVSGAEPERILQVQEMLAERLRNSTPGFPASTLGL